MNKSLLLILVFAFVLVNACQNGHKSQSWHPGTPKQGKAKRR